MELFGILFGLLFFPAAIIAWFAYARKRKLSTPLRVIGAFLVPGLPLLAVFSMASYMFLDEPLVFAVREGKTAEVKALLARGANPNAEFEGSPALQQAAQYGYTDIVRLLLAHGARTDVKNDSNGQSPLRSAQKYGHKEIERLLRQAGANR